MDKVWVKLALENLWDLGALGANPLCDKVAPPGSGTAKRAQALRDTILHAAQGLKTGGQASHFNILNRTFGLQGDARRHYQLYPTRPSRDDIMAELGLRSKAEYEQRLAAAIAALIAALQDCVVEPHKG
jgi:hypothetical protein